jgi:hypothetical protein
MHANAIISKHINCMNPYGVFEPMDIISTYYLNCTLKILILTHFQNFPVSIENFFSLCKAFVKTKVSTFTDICYAL